jgi:hypothetical protein
VFWRGRPVAASRALVTRQSAGFALYTRRYKNRNPKLPSWVVDWTEIRASTTLNPTFAGSHLRYRAARDRVVIVIRGGLRREIIVRGQVVGRIGALLPVVSAAQPVPAVNYSTAVSELASYLDKTHELARAYVQDPYPYLPGNQPLEEAVWRTLIGDKTCSVRPEPVTCGQTLKHHLKILKEGAELNSALGGGMLSDNSFWSDPVLEKLARLHGADEPEENRQALREMNDIKPLFDSGKGSTPYVFYVTDRGLYRHGPASQLSWRYDMSNSRPKGSLCAARCQIRCHATDASVRARYAVRIYCDGDWR